MIEKDGLTSYISAFVDELVRVNVRNVVISPGSRSTPFAMLMEEHEDMTTWMNIDERSAAYFALGMAKASKNPVALVCTSGTAVANYLPAIVEARLSRIPLLVITADRPHELRDVGAPQAINQIDIFGKNVKWFVEMAIHDSSSTMINYARTMAGRAAAISKSGLAGPVHLNFPVREPLVPDFHSPNMWAGGRLDSNPYISFDTGKTELSATYVENLAKELNQLQKGLIICGPNEDEELHEQIVKLANALQYPILADPLSQLRSGKHDKSYIIDGYDSFLRDKRIKERLKPEVIIRFGAMPVSKALLLFIQDHIESKQIIIEENEGWREPTLLASHMIHTDSVHFCKQLVKHNHVKSEQNHWVTKWKTINETSKSTLRNVLGTDALFEGKVISELITHLPDQSALFVGNSMPIRDLDTFFFNEDHKQIRVFANRGANGIDGIISSALGASTVLQPLPLVLIVGDLTFFHDMNGLLAAKLHDLNITIVVINNDGGGIFSFLPQAKQEKHFEKLFGTPIGLDYRHVVNMYNGQYNLINSWSSFQEAVKRSIAEGGLHVIEVPSDREKNEVLHRSVWSDVMTNLQELR